MHKKIDLSVHPKPSRREWLARAARLSLALPAAFSAHLLPFADLPSTSPYGILPSPGSAAPQFTADQEAFLEEIEKASFLYFWEAADPETGQVKDRCGADGPDARRVSSIAATGFGLTALCIAERRGWGDSASIRRRVLATLRFLFSQAPQEHGFLYHFMDMRTGARMRRCELSSIDTALLLCGALACRAYFADEEIRSLATRLYERVDWPWMLNGGATLSMGWKPESGFLEDRWDSYSELLMLYLMGLGSPTHALPAETWDAWERPAYQYKGVHYIGSEAPLFVHQFSHAWFDFRGRRDRYADYFANSAAATKAHKAWCLDLAKEFPDYSEDLWGITSSDSRHGYVGWGGPPRSGPIDGTIVPCAAAGSLPFLPQECLRVLRTIREKYGTRAWKRYGFVDAFHPRKNWYNPDVIGIDVGITLLMAENARSGFVWEIFMKDADVRRGMERAGFHP
jgi:hypothetical protein